MEKKYIITNAFEIDEYVNIFYVRWIILNHIRIVTPSVSYNGSYFPFLTDLNILFSDEGISTSSRNKNCVGHGNCCVPSFD